MKKKLESLGLEHVQLSFQDTENERMPTELGDSKVVMQKLEVAKWVRDVELPFTCNCVVHRQNIDNLENFIQMALDLDAERVK